MALIVGLCFWANSYAAVDLLDIYQQALRSDPTFQAAYSTYLSTSENIPIARSDLLPFLTGTGTVTGLHNHQEFPDAPPEATRSISAGVLQQFYALTVTQPIFNYAAWRQLKSAKATVKQAYAIFSGSAQDLIIRTAQTYFTVLDAEDILRFTRAEKRASYRRLQESTERYNVGLEAITTVYEAQAEYDRIASDEIAAENEVVNSREALRQLTGEVYSDLKRIEGEAPLISPQPENVQAWADIATEQNYTILAGTYAVEAAEENIAVQRAGNYPTVDALGAYTLSDNANLVGLGGTPDVVAPVGGANKFRSQVISGGIVATLPLIQGGRVRANTRQARYDFETAKANLEFNYRDAVINTHQSYNDVLSGIGRVKADRQSIISGQNSLDSVEAQFRVGTRTIVDVLDSQRNLFDVQRMHATDTYQYILSTLQLKFAAGTLSVTDIEQINDWLYNPPEALKEEYAIKSLISIADIGSIPEYNPFEITPVERPAMDETAIQSEQLSPEEIEGQVEPPMDALIAAQEELERNLDLLEKSVGQEPQQSQQPQEPMPTVEQEQQQPQEPMPTVEQEPQQPQEPMPTVDQEPTATVDQQSSATTTPSV